jgi:hypothetical protein
VECQSRCSSHFLMKLSGQDMLLYSKFRSIIETEHYRIRGSLCIAELQCAVPTSISMLNPKSGMMPKFRLDAHSYLFTMQYSSITRLFHFAKSPVRQFGVFFTADTSPAPQDRVGVILLLNTQQPWIIFSKE